MTVVLGILKKCIVKKCNDNTTEHTKRENHNVGVITKK